MMKLLWYYVLLVSLWIQSNVGANTAQNVYWGDWSPWSLCSAQCGYGISTRSRQCQRAYINVQDLLQEDSTVCLGDSTQIKGCHVKPCPPEAASRNQKSCSEFNSRMFSGKQYMWEPIIHLNAACKMSCRAKGVHFYANLADRAEDGTPCKLGATDAICVTGVCKRVGCDQVINSAAVKDICGICSGNGSSCQTISGIFTSTELKRGLNYIISIPAGSTNINITELQASRNSLIMLTETGKTFVSDDMTNPASHVVEAAGTVFTYSTNNFLIHKESIFSPGPTNTSVILKLLMRGSNPGIMYTFNVPKEVTSSVIQQIRHHSQPVELSSETRDEQNHNFEAFSSKHDDSISLKNDPANPSSDESLTIQPTVGPHDHLSFDNRDTNQESSTNIIDHNETTLPSLFKAPSTNHDNLSSVYDEDSNNVSNDIVPNLSDNDQYLDDLSFKTTFRTTASLEVTEVPPLHQEENEVYWDTVLTTETSTIHIKNKHKHAHSSDNTDADAADIVSKESENSELTKMSDVALDDGRNESYKSNSKGEGNKWTETFTNISNSNSILVNDLVKSVINDGKIKDRDVSLTLNESEVLLQKSAQSLNKSVAARDIENSKSISKEHEYNDDQSKNTFKDNSEFSSLNNFDSRQQEKETQSKIAQNIDKSDSFEKNEELFSKTQKSNSNYKIPRYSQSFTFAERYKDGHSSKLSSNSSQQSKPHHTRRQHSQLKNDLKASSKQNSLQVDSKTSQYSAYNQQKEFDGNSKRNTFHAHGIDSGLENIENRRDHESSTSQVDRNSQRVGSDRHQRDRNEQITRETQMRERQTIIEERRRQMEEQRSQYNQRLREYHEMLRQRQAAIDESRRQRSHHLDISRNAGSQNSVNPRRPHHQENNPLMSPRDGVSTNVQSSQSYGSVRRYSPETNFTDTSKDTQGYDQSHIKNGNTHTSTDSKHAIIHSSHSLQIRNQEQLERISEQSQRETPWRRQTVYQPSAKEGDIKDDNHLINRESRNYKSDRHNRKHQEHKESSNRQANSPKVPVVLQPPRLEYPESFDGDRMNSFPSQIIPRVQQTAPRYIPGVSSHTSAHSALTGAETQQESNKISSDNQISSSRKSTVFKPLGPTDTLPNYIPLNKLDTAHSSTYEWRISGLTECTHSCGGGVQQTIVVCVDTLTQAIVTDENCRHIPKPKLTGVPCNTRPCSAEWTPGPWSSCSMTCGKGEQTRLVTCQARVSPTLSMTMPSSNCESQEQIPSRQPCNNKPCSIWRVGIWSNCSTPCGDGHKTRDVECVDLQNNIVSDDACSELRPDSEEKCNLGECGKGWFFTDWPAECPAECGVGEVTRKVFCADETGSALPDSRCDVSQRPAVSQSCRVSRPCGGLWFIGQWSKCDAVCGSGNKRRPVLCIKELPGGVRAIVDDENCEDSVKPVELEPCEAPSCTSQWYMTSWSQCSQSCGTGYRTREVKCLTPEQKPHDDCPLQSRPKTRDVCNIHDCVDAGSEGNSTEENPGCVNKFAQCSVVKRARLCQYNYYKTVCCKACADDT